MLRSLRQLSGVALLATIVTHNIAVAHTSLLASNPMNGSIYDSPPQLVTLNFNTDVRLTWLIITDQDGAELDTEFVLSPDLATEFAVGLPPLTSGEYQCEWRALSADGHPVDGAFSFSVIGR